LGVTVQIVYQFGARTDEVELRIERPDATVGELAGALAAPTPDLVVDGRLTAASRRLDDCGLVDGALVQPAGAAAPMVSQRVVVRVIGGLGAGRSIPLGVGVATIGRDPHVEITLEDPAVLVPAAAGGAGHEAFPFLGVLLSNWS
jgi:S-DNA-T family DNA segregation ATPase FtsK/SpoIIIE